MVTCVIFVVAAICFVVWLITTQNAMLAASSKAVSTADQWSDADYPDVTDTEIGVKARGSQARTELTQTRAAALAIRRAMLDRIAASQPDEDRLRDRLIAGVQIIDAIRKAMERAVADGEIEATKDLMDDIVRRD